MAVSNTHNPQNGFCSKTLIFRSIRPPSQLPPQSTHLSVTDFVFSLLDTNAGAAATASLIDATTRHFIPYSDVKFFVRNLSAAIRQPPVSLSHGDCAFVISHNSSYLPILYLSLFSVGVIVSTANPAGSIHEISRQIQICKPAVVFATAEALQKLSDVRFYNRIVLIDSNEFESMMRVESNGNDAQINVSQSDTAVILYSSGTTGKMKGVKLTHRNLMSSVAGAITRRETRPSPAVFLCTVPYFHVYGFTLCIRMVACGESLVSIAKYDLRLMIMSIKAFGVRYLALAPPVVAALVDQNNEELNGSNWSSLEAVFSGGAPLTVAVIRKFKRRFPNVSLVQDILTEVIVPMSLGTKSISAWKSTEFLPAATSKNNSLYIINMVIYNSINERRI